jgi:hypothetical protein
MHHESEIKALTLAQLVIDIEVARYPEVCPEFCLADQNNKQSDKIGC